MLDLSLKAIDRVIALLKGRVDDKRKFMQEHVSPIFSEMEIIHKNYIHSFSDIIQSIKNADKTMDLIEIVLHKKMEFEHIRIKAQSFAKIARESKRVPDPAKKFFDECLRYFYRQSDVIWDRNYNTAFTSMIEVLSTIEQSDDINKSKDRLILEFEACIDVTRECWITLTEEYSKCKLEMLR